jgi:hypothetical protein
MAGSTQKAQVLDFLGVASVQNNPTANTARVYFDQATNAFYVVDPSGSALLNNGGVVGFSEDFIGTTAALTLSTAGVAVAVFDTPWLLDIITGGTGSVAASNPADNIHIGAALLTSPATTNDGVALARSLNGSLVFPTVTASGWVLSCWFQTGAAITNYCVRIGVMGGAGNDPNNNGAWIEYDTANSNSNSTFTLRTQNGGTSSYGVSTVTPQVSTWYHVQLSSNGSAVSMSIGTANAALGSPVSVSTNLTATYQIIAAQVLARGAAARTLNLDWISYLYPTGRL